MAYQECETRAVQLVDIPLVKRLVENGTVLDSEVAFTRVANSPRSALFSSFFLPQRGLHTLVARQDRHHVVGQFRLRNDESHARIVYLAPGLAHDADNTIYLHLLDAMAAEAGRRGAQTLTAEVDEYLHLFETMRISGFAIYARQEIWQRYPDEPVDLPDDVELTEETDADTHGIQLLYSNIVPRLVQQIAIPPSDSRGLVYRKNDRVEGYLAVSEGRYGIYIMPYLHPDVFSDAASVIAAAVRTCGHSGRVPIYVSVRRYQDWLEDALLDLGFEPFTRQAVMVRHIAAGIRSAAFAPLHHRLEAIPSHPPITEAIFENHNQE
jgi:hypothetical protein